jgi:PPOX class probable F420-dependent enzyme
MSDDDRLLDLFGAKGNGTLTTLKRDGRPQLSIVSYCFDREQKLIRISITDDRAKTRNLRRDPRASFLVTTPDLGGYAVAEATATLSEVTTDPHDAAAEELVEVYRLVAGEHPDWDEYRAAMIDQRRLVLRLPIARLYGWSGRS